jgi:hypothetical protein
MTIENPDISNVKSWVTSLSSVASDYQSFECGVTEWSVIHCPYSLPLICLNCSGILDHYCELDSSEILALLDSSPHASFISWLDPPSDPVGQLSMLYLQLDEKSSPPSFDNLEVLSITNTTVEIQAIMSGEGSLEKDKFSVNLCR